MCKINFISVQHLFYAMSFENCILVCACVWAHTHGCMRVQAHVCIYIVTFLWYVTVISGFWIWQLDLFGFSPGRATNNYLLHSFVPHKLKTLIFWVRYSVLPFLADESSHLSVWLHFWLLTCRQTLTGCSYQVLCHSLPQLSNQLIW
jgi:hypothetical protein